MEAGTWAVILFLLAVFGIILYFLLQPSGPKTAMQPCVNDTDCLSGKCQNNYCALSDVGAGCKTDYDCAKGLCKNSICQLGDINDKCSKNADCASGQCYNQKCMEATTVGICMLVSPLKPIAGLFIIFLLAAIVMIIFGLNPKGGITYGKWGVWGPLGLFIFSLAMIYLAYFVC